MSPPYHGGGYILSEAQTAVCPQHSPRIGWTALSPATIAATHGVQEGHVGPRYAVAAAGADIFDLEGGALALPSGTASNRLACQVLTGTIAATTTTADASCDCTLVFVSVVARVVTLAKPYRLTSTYVLNTHRSECGLKVHFSSGDVRQLL
jgi:hypothetical protein